MVAKRILGGLAAAGALAFVLGVAPRAALAKPNASGVVGKFSIAGNGTATDDKNTGTCPDVACPNATDWCACITTTGVTTGSGLGNLNITAEISIDFSDQFGNLFGTPNGSGGRCYGTSGIANITAAGGSSMLVSLSGTDCDQVPVGTNCDVDPSGCQYPAGTNGNYSVISATGKFAGTSNIGTFSLYDSDVDTVNAAANYSFTGTLNN